jgi:phenylacetate-CoA ligase
MWLAIPGTRSAFLSIYHLSEAHKGQLRDRLLEFKPNMLYGYASALSQLASLFSPGDLDELRGIRCISTSETLLPEQRRQIVRNLGATVHNQYGSQEGQHFVLECQYERMHIHPRRGIVEILKFDSDVAADPGELGRVIVTGLTNRSMPLIRYSIGDSAVSTGFTSGCQCGVQWPTIGAVYGRTEDLVRTRDGRRIGLLSHATTKDLKGVLQSQIVQTDFGRFTYRIRLEHGADHRQIEQHIVRELSNRLGEKIQVNFEYVDALERTAAGKIQAVIVRF